MSILESLGEFLSNILSYLSQIISLLGKLPTFIYPFALLFVLGCVILMILDRR